MLDRSKWPPVTTELERAAAVTHGWPLSLNGTVAVAEQVAVSVLRRLQIAGIL